MKDFEYQMTTRDRAYHVANCNYQMLKNPVNYRKDNKVNLKNMMASLHYKTDPEFALYYEEAAKRLLEKENR